MSVLTIVGTAKGVFLLRSGPDRKSWTVEGPLFKGWKVTAAARDSSGRTILATASDVYGAALHVSDNLTDWRQIETGPAYPQGGDRKLNQIWTVFQGAGGIYAGVDQAGLFRSTDGGESWKPVEGLNEHPTRPAWQPGAGGLCAHAVLQDARDPKRLWCGISAVGVFRSEDGGRTWTSRNEGVTIVLEDQKHKDVGYCVHGLTHDPADADTIYRQDHSGMYRTRNGGDSWERIESGLPSRFGFPIVMDRRTGSIYVVPLESDEHRLTTEGKLRVYRSRDGGDSWQPLTRGLPQSNVHTIVLRGAMTTDGLDPCGITFGTTSGTVHTSRDGGESWTDIPVLLPRILCVESFTEA